MAQVNLATLIVRIRASTSQFDKNIASASRRMARFGRGMQQAGSSLTRAITAPLLLLGGGALKASIDWETSMADVRKTVDGTAEEMAQLEQTLISMSNRLPTSAREIASVAAEAGRLGVKAKDMEFFADTVIRLAETSTLGLEEAAIGLARLAKITQLPLDQIDRLANSITVLGSEISANETDITNFSLRIAAAGKIIGLTNAQTIGFAAGISELGVKAERGGTAISKTFFAISEAVSDGGDTLETFAATAGLTVDGFVRLFRTDAAEAVIRFVQGLGEVNDASTSSFKKLESVGLAGDRLKQVLLTAASAGDSLRVAVDKGTKAWGDNAKLIELSNIKYATTASKLKIVRNQIVNVAKELGDELQPVLLSILEVVRDDLIPAFRSLVDTYKSLSQGTKTFVSTSLALVAALGPLLLAVGAVTLAARGLFTVTGLVVPLLGKLLTAAIVAVKLAAMGLATAISLLLSPLGKLVLGATAMVTVSEKLKAATEGMRGPLGGFSKELQKALMTRRVEKFTEANKELLDAFFAGATAADLQTIALGKLRAEQERVNEANEAFTKFQLRMTELDVDKKIQDLTRRLGEMAAVSKRTGSEQGFLQKALLEVNKTYEETVKTLGENHIFSVELLQDIEGIRAKLNELSATPDPFKQLAIDTATEALDRYFEAMHDASFSTKVLADVQGGLQQEIQATEQRLKAMFDAAGGDLERLAANPQWLALGQKLIATDEQVLVNQNAWVQWGANIMGTLRNSQLVLNEFSTFTLDIFNQFTEGLGNAVARAIVFGEDFGAAFKSIMQNLAVQVISTLVSVAAQLLVFSIVAKLIGTALFLAALGPEKGKTFAGAFSAATIALGPAGFLTGLPFAYAVSQVAIMSGAATAATLATGGLTRDEGFAFLHRNEVVAPFSDVVDMVGGGGRGMQLNLYVGGRRIAQEILEWMPGIINKKLGAGGRGR